MRHFIFSFILLVLTFPSLTFGDSLYSEATFRSLAGDRRAYQAGDSLTVLVYEISSATASADTKTAKSGGIGLGIKFPSVNYSPSIKANEDFNGKGTIQRSGKLLAQISVTVQAIASNGDMAIKGQQLLEINGEKQQIQLEGRVRPQDITEHNTVLSSRVADAKISYVGEGSLSVKQTPGILSVIFSILGLL